MRILLDQAVYDQRNKGNVALLQAAVSRLTMLWPDAEISVLTEAPYLMKLYCPTAYPVSVHPWQNWSHKRGQFEKFNRPIPRHALHILLELREAVWHHYPTLVSGDWRQGIKKLIGRNNREQVDEPEIESGSVESVFGSDLVEGKSQDFLEALINADLVVATGGGYLCDTDKQYTLQVFDTLEMAIRMGKPTAMVGQGVGPLHDPELRSRLKKILPYVDLILIREPKIAQPLLDSLGVSMDRVLMTGDDAIQMAYEARTSGWGVEIGVNLRLARYTEVEQAYIEKVRPAIHQAARKYGSPLMALPISGHVKEADLEVIRGILKGYEKVSIDWRRFDQPLNMIDKIGHCRLVVTGAFHPAVFALAQGIPVVGLVKSVTYIDKFSALRDEFGPACQLIHLDDEQLSDKLIAAIDTAWGSAEQVRPQLLDAAVRQIEWGNAGYQRLYDIVASRNLEPSLMQ